MYPSNPNYYLTWSRAYRAMLSQVGAFGHKSSPRGEPTRELTNIQIEIVQPQRLIRIEGRDLKYEIGALEACSLVGQFNVPEEFTNRIKKFGLFTQNGVQWGSYGVRIHGDLGQVVRLLQADPDSRQAVLTLFDSDRDLNRGEPDIPCTIAVQFLLRYGALSMRTVMRSNDLWLGTPYDSIQFFALHSAVATALGVPVGSYFHSVGSLHLYERDRMKAARVKAINGLNIEPPYWSGSTIAEISSTARRILLYGEKGETQFERWLHDQLHG